MTSLLVHYGKYYHLYHTHTANNVFLDQVLRDTPGMRVDYESLSHHGIPVYLISGTIQ